MTADFSTWRREAESLGRNLERPELDAAFALVRKDLEQSLDSLEKRTLAGLSQDSESAKAIAAGESEAERERRCFEQHPDEHQWFRPIEGKPEITPYRTRSGLLLNTAPADGRCWDAPLPCTPNPAPNLRLRDSTNLSRGFMVDGAWQMENWPYDWQPRFLETWRKSRSRGSE